MVGLCHLCHRWCSRVPVGTSSCTGWCQAVGRARTVTPSLGPCYSSTQTWSHCSCWWTTAGTLSAKPQCNRSPFGCLKKCKNHLCQKNKSIMIKQPEGQRRHSFSCDVFAPDSLAACFQAAMVLPIHSVPVELGSKPSLHSQR